MNARDRHLKRVRVVVISMMTTVAVSLLSLFGAGGAQAAIIKKCPAPGSLKSAVGTSVKIVTDKAGADVFCDYTAALPAFKQDSISISAEPVSGSDAELLNDAKSFAKALKAPLKKLSGIGDDAWEYTEPKSNLGGNGNPTTTVTIVVGKREVTVIANISAKNVLAIAKQVG